MSAELEQAAKEHQSSTSWAQRLYLAGLYLYAFTCHFSISASQTSLALALIGFLGLFVTGKTRPEKTPLDLPFAFLATTGLLSVFRAEDLSRAMPEMKVYLIIFCFYIPYWYKLSDRQLMKIFGVFVSSAALVAIVNSLRLPYLELPGNRAKGFYSMPMTFGECQALGLLSATVLFGCIRRSFIGTALLVLATASTAYSVLFSMVRSAWIGLSVGLTILFFRFPRRTAVVILIILAAVAPFMYVNPDMRDRIVGLDPKKTADLGSMQIDNLPESGSLQASYYRMTIWWRGFKMLENNYPFGVGIRNVKNWYQKLASEYEHQNQLIWGHQHNNFMQTFASSGYLGLIAFFNFIIAALVFVWKPARNGETPASLLNRGTSAIYICFIVYGIGEFSWGDEEVTMMALFLVGLLMNPHPAATSSDSLPQAAITS